MSGIVVYMIVTTPLVRLCFAAIPVKLLLSHMLRHILTYAQYLALVYITMDTDCGYIGYK